MIAVRELTADRTTCIPLEDAETDQEQVMPVTSVKKGVENSLASVLVVAMSQSMLWVPPSETPPSFLQEMSSPYVPPGGPAPQRDRQAVSATAAINRAQAARILSPPIDCYPNGTGQAWYRGPGSFSPIRQGIREKLDGLAGWASRPAGPFRHHNQSGGRASQRLDPLE